MSERREIDRLVDAACGGDSHAFGGLFDRFYQPVYRYAFARLGSAGDAEDAAAETFMSVLTALPRFTWRGAPFEAWLIRIAASAPEAAESGPEIAMNAVGVNLAEGALPADLSALVPSVPDILSELPVPDVPEPPAGPDLPGVPELPDLPTPPLGRP